MKYLRLENFFRVSILFFIVIFIFSGCVSTQIQKEGPDNKLNAESLDDSNKEEIPFATPDVIKMYEANLAKEYSIGPGDRIKVDVWNRPELSGEHLVGPYGNITLPLIGEFHIGGNTRKDATKCLFQTLR